MLVAEMRGFRKASAGNPTNEQQVVLAKLMSRLEALEERVIIDEEFTRSRNRGIDPESNTDTLASPTVPNPTVPNVPIAQPSSMKATPIAAALPSPPNAIDAYPVLQRTPLSAIIRVNKIAAAEAIYSDNSSVYCKSMLWELDGNGMFKLEPSITHFTLDLGVNRGTTVADFLTRIPTQFVIGVEANPFLWSMHTYTSSKYNVRWSRGKKFPYCASMDKEIYKQSSVMELNRKRCLVINAAAASTPGVTEFYIGYGWEENGNAPDDVGSMFDWKDPQRRATRKGRHVVVPKVRLDSILQFVPQHLVWDCLKIDIQGADTDALISAREYVQKFLCVVGEFDTGAYSVPAGVVTDEHPFLIKHGFIEVKQTGSKNADGFWINTRYLDRFAKKEYSCFVYDNVRPHEDIMARIAQYNNKTVDIPPKAV
jgi:hypothetical protein